MRDYGKVSPRFWTGDTGRAMRGKPNVQLVAMYLITAPGANMIGLFYVPTVIVAHEIGISDTEVRGALETLGRLGIAHYDYAQELVWIPEMARHQVAETLAGKDKRKVAIEHELEPFKRVDHPFYSAFMKRYGAAFGMAYEPRNTDLLPHQKGSEVASPPLAMGSHDSDKPIVTPSEGVAEDGATPSKPRSGSGSRSGTRTREAVAVSDQDRQTPPDRLWPALRWKDLYGRAWIEKYGGLHYGMGDGDSKGIARLGDLLGEMPEIERIGTQARAPAMFAEFLASTNPATVAARHPFAFFVTAFGGLRVSKAKAPEPERPKGPIYARLV